MRVILLYISLLLLHQLAPMMMAPAHITPIMVPVLLETVYRSNAIQELFVGNFTGMLTRIQRGLAWKTLASVCEQLVDHEGVLARQTKTLLVAETQEDDAAVGEANLDFFYGLKEDEIKRKKREVEEEEEEDVFELIWEVVQQEWICPSFRFLDPLPPPPHKCDRAIYYILARSPPRSTGD